MRFHHDDEQQSIRPQPPCARRVTAASHAGVVATRHFSGTRRSVGAAPSIWRDAAVTRAIRLLPRAAGCERKDAWKSPSGEFFFC